MALADDPRAFILRMFELEAREGRGEACRIFPDGVQPPGVPLAEGECVFAVYKAKYHYTATSLIIRDADGFTTIRWAEVAHCSSRHGDGSRVAQLTLADGREVTVKLAEFVKGWSGRTSQLFHGMIERWGARSAFGPMPMTIAEFFLQAKDDYSFAPNLEPHPSLAELRSALERISAAPGVRQLALIPANAAGEELAVTQIAIACDAPCVAIEDMAARLQATCVTTADAAMLAKLGLAGTSLQVKVLAWD